MSDSKHTNLDLSKVNFSGRYVSTQEALEDVEPFPIKVSKGRRSIRKTRYTIQPGDICLYNGKKIATTGTHCKGKSIMLNGKSISIKKVQLLHHAGGWKAVG